MSGLGRREFLGGVVAAAAVGPGVAFGAEKADVVEVSGTDRKAMVKAALAALGGMGAFVGKGQKVVLKPNLSFANPMAWATTTHPDTILAVAQACFDAGAKEVRVVDNPLADAEKCLERNGSGAMLKTMPELTLRMLADHDEFREVAIPNGVTLKSTEVAKAILDADVFINLPQAKHHYAAGVSFGLKNAMGAVWSRKPLHFMHELQQAIADLNLAVRPHLTLLDAVAVLTSSGPKGPGDVATPGKLLAGRGVASVDALGLTATKFGGKQLQPADARHIVAAARAGLGEFDVQKLKVLRVTA